MRALVRPIWLFVAAAVLAPLPHAVHAAAADDACAVLTSAQVGAAVGVAVGAGTYVTPTFKRTCTWVPSDSASGIRFVTLNLQSIAQFDAGKRAATYGVVTPVGGMGDDAFYLGVGSTEGLIVKKGQRAFKIAVYSTLPLEKKRAMERALAQRVLARL